MSAIVINTQKKSIIGKNIYLLLLQEKETKNADKKQYMNYEKIKIQNILVKNSIFRNQFLFQLSQQLLSRNQQKYRAYRILMGRCFNNWKNLREEIYICENCI